MSFGGGSFNYFDAATGSNAYERQSWRDSYNGGYAAGDFTGNVNASLAEERSNFQGATWSGSSTQPSALQLAQSMGGPGYSAISNGPQSSVSTGPGNAVVVSAPRGASSGSLTFAGGGVKPKPGEQSSAPVFVPGFGPKTKVHDGDFRHMGIGFGLTWASPADYAQGQDIEDEMGEWGALPFQIHKTLLETGINAGRAGGWAVQSVKDAAAPFVDRTGEWWNGAQGEVRNIDAGRVNPFGYAQSPF